MRTFENQLASESSQGLRRVLEMLRHFGHVLWSSFHRHHDEPLTPACYDAE